MKRRWLVVYPARSGMAELYNVGVVEASCLSEAIARGREIFTTTAQLEAWPLDEVESGWSYYR